MQKSLNNLLPYDGIVYYHDQVFNSLEADTYLNRLFRQIDWQNDEVIMFGKRIITKRKVAWYGDRPFRYTYSKITRTALPWIKELQGIKDRTEQLTREQYNSCLLNLYHSGDEGMGWHSDDEKELREDAAIASVSFGSTRKFSFKHKNTKERIDIELDTGSLLLMKGNTQTHWLHQLPKTKKVKDLRINLTFRTML